MSFLNKPIKSGEPLAGITRVLLLLLLGALLSALVSFSGNPLSLTPPQHLLSYSYTVPRIKGGTALHMAMVHDILHERYLRHGNAWYEKQLQITEPLLPATMATQALPQQLDNMDDRAVALILLHRESEAVALMRKKLALLPNIKQPQFKSGEDYLEQDTKQIEYPRTLTSIQLQYYSAHANLGTALIHGSFANALTGSPEARQLLSEGLAEIEQAIAINPLAHFGRENWQAIAVSHFLACIDHHELLTQYAATGEPLLHDPAETLHSVGFSRLLGYAMTPDDQISPQRRADLRYNVPRAFVFTDEWLSLTNAPYTGYAPFDEPTLAIIGMWTLGGGPNPHFALALGCLMEDVGQRNIAWNAYERATEMSDQFWPTADIRDKLIAYCRARQDAIASSIAPKNPQAWQDQMRKTHTAELAWGRQYQRDYQDYEAAQINAGTPIDSPHFYDAFFANRPSIASPVGLADELLLTYTKPQTLIDWLPTFLLTSSFCLLIDHLHAIWRKKRNRATPTC